MRIVRFIAIALTICVINSSAQGADFFESPGRGQMRLAQVLDYYGQIRGLRVISEIQDDVMINLPPLGSASEQSAARIIEMVLRRHEIALVRVDDRTIKAVVAWTPFCERPDTTPPCLFVTEPRNGLVTTRSWIDIRGIVSDDSGRAHALISGEWQHGSEGDTFYYSKYELTNGVNTIIVTAQDDAKNTATQIVTVVLDPSSDTEAPSASLLLPYGDMSSPATCCSVKTLDVDGVTDDETAVISLWVTSSDTKLGPYRMVNSGSSFHGRIDLSPGYNRIDVLASDAAWNTSTNTHAIFNDTTRVFRITYPRSYQVMNARSTEVWGVASGEFINAQITVNGQSATIFPRSNQVGFVTWVPVPVDSGLTMIWAEAVLDGKRCFTQ